MKEQCDWWRRKLREVVWSCTRHVDNLLCLWCVEKHHWKPLLVYQLRWGPAGPSFHFPVCETWSVTASVSVKWPKAEERRDKFAALHWKRWLGSISSFSHCSLHRCLNLNFLTSICPPIFNPHCQDLVPIFLISSSTPVLAFPHLYLFPWSFPGGVEPGEDDVEEARGGVVSFPWRGLRLGHAQVLKIYKCSYKPVL